MKTKNLIVVSILILSALILVFAGCSEKSLKGNLLTPQPPIVYWAQVANDSLNHRNPLLHWYSTDQDGVVLDYLYAVMLASTVDSQVTAYGSMQAFLNQFPSATPWTTIHTDSATIPLIASGDTSVFIDQYVFVKAMDEDSLYSNVIYKRMARNNHPPTCYVVVPMDTTGAIIQQWSLPETTATWKGIRVAWIGKDSIDIPGAIQPDFEWNIRLYGPFSDYALCDTMPNNLYREYHSSLDSTNIWIRDKQKYMTGLQTGWFVVYARNRDDAYTPSVPSLGYINCYEPTWIRHAADTKPILVADHSYYYNGGHDGRAYGELTISEKDSVRSFYMQMLQGAGFDTLLDVDWKYLMNNTSAQAIAKSDLYNHRMVIILDTDFHYSLSRDKQESEYALYMDVDGMAWLVGRQSFDEGSNGGLIQFGPNGDANRFHAIAYKYFNLTGVFAQQELNLHQAEFAGAASNLGNFPDLSIDTLKTAQCNWIRGAEQFDYTHGLPGVDYLMWLSTSDSMQTVYKYSATGPDTSSFQGFPVAVRFDRGTYKTSYFSFPLYFIQREQAQVVFQQMLAWFNPRNY